MKKRSLPELEHSVEIEVNGEYREFDLTIAVCIDNDGIGSYECHGFKGFHSGTDYIEDWNIVSMALNGDPIHFGSFSTEDQETINKDIQKWIDSGSAMEILSNRKESI